MPTMILKIYSHSMFAMITLGAPPLVLVMLHKWWRYLFWAPRHIHCDYLLRFEQTIPDRDA